jgi:hypothetical protein
LEFGLTLEISHEVYHRASLVHSISDFLGERLGANKYGTAVDCYLIGCICVSNDFKWFFPARRRRYEKSERYPRYDVTFDFDAFRDGTDKEIALHVFRSLCESKVKVETLNSDKFDFDFDKFFKDMEELGDEYVQAIED